VPSWYIFPRFDVVCQEKSATLLHSGACFSVKVFFSEISIQFLERQACDVTPGQTISCAIHRLFLQGLAIEKNLSGYCLPLKSIFLMATNRAASKQQNV
jgi:hypothetical protein